MPNHPGGLFLLLGQVLCPYQKQQILNQKGTGCLVRTDSASDGSANTHAVVPWLPHCAVISALRSFYLPPVTGSAALRQTVIYAVMFLKVDERRRSVL